MNENYTWANKQIRVMTNALLSTKTKTMRKSERVPENGENAKRNMNVRVHAFASIYTVFSVCHAQPCYCSDERLGSPRRELTCSVAP